MQKEQKEMRQTSSLQTQKKIARERKILPNYSELGRVPQPHELLWQRAAFYSSVCPQYLVQPISWHVLAID